MFRAYKRPYFSETRFNTVTSDLCPPSSHLTVSYFNSWSVHRCFFLPKRTPSHTFVKIRPRNALRASILQTAGLPTQITILTDTQYSDLTYNRDNGSVRLQRTRPERKRLQCLQWTLSNFSSNIACTQRTFMKKLNVCSSTKLVVRFLRFMDILVIVFGFFELPTQGQSGRR